MTIQMSTFGLMQNGFKLVASYEMISKGERKLNVECWKGNDEYLVKHWESGRRSFTHVYEDKEKANAKFLQLKKMYTWTKRVM